jgi:hypothetical protein
VKRFEKLMLLIAYVLTFLIVLACAVVSKGVTLFMFSQVSIFINAAAVAIVFFAIIVQVVEV